MLLLPRPLRPRILVGYFLGVALIACNEGGLKAAQSSARVPAVFDMPGQAVLQDEAHVGVVNGKLAAGIRYGEVATVSGLWSPPGVSGNFQFEARADGEKVKTSRWTWRPFQVERAGRAGHVEVSSKTTLIYGQRAALVEFSCHNLGRSSVPIDLFALGWLDVVRDWDFARPESRSETALSVEGSRLWMRQGGWAVVLQGDGADWAWQISGNLAHARTLLPSQQSRTYRVAIVMGPAAEAEASIGAIMLDPGGAVRTAESEYTRRVEDLFSKLPRLESSNPQLVRWYERSLVHLLMNRWDLPDFLLHPYYSTGSVNGGCVANYLWNFGEPWEIFPLYDPAAARSHIRHFLEIDLFKHFNFLPVTGQASGPWYMVNQEKIIGLTYFYVLLTGDTAFLQERVDGKSIRDHMVLHAMFGDDRTRPMSLIDYGPSGSHLELRRGYAYNHISPDLNARRYASYLRAATLCDLAGEPAGYLRERAALLKPLLKERLWDASARWFRFEGPQGKRDLRYTVQLFKPVGTGVLDAECEEGLLSHLNAREFLSDYGLHSLSKLDPAYDQLDIDNGGGGICNSFPPQIVERLYLARRPELAADLLRRLLWWGERLPYWGDSIVANAKDYRRDTPLQCTFDGAAGAQAIIFGVFGVRAEPNGDVVIAAHPLPFASSVRLRDLRVLGHRLDVHLEGGGFEVKAETKRVHARDGEQVRVVRGGNLRVEPVPAR